MESTPTAPVVIAIAFVDRINRRDLDALVAMMHVDHRLEVCNEVPITGRHANADAWRGYFDAFPHYLIYPRRVAETADGEVTRWMLIEDTPANRGIHGLDVV